MKQAIRLLALAQTSQEPTVASIPGILLRAFMRTTARLVLVLTGFTAALTVALFSLALFLATWPSVHRKTH